MLLNFGYETGIDKQSNLLFWQLDSRQGIAEPMERWIEIAFDQRADLK